MERGTFDQNKLLRTIGKLMVSSAICLSWYGSIFLKITSRTLTMPWCPEPCPGLTFPITRSRNWATTLTSQLTCPSLISMLASTNWPVWVQSMCLTRWKHCSSMTTPSLKWSPTPSSRNPSLSKWTCLSTRFQVSLKHPLDCPQKCLTLLCFCWAEIQLSVIVRCSGSNPSMTTTIAFRGIQS